jgi:hypothetical protein
MGLTQKPFKINQLIDSGTPEIERVDVQASSRLTARYLYHKYMLCQAILVRNTEKGLATLKQKGYPT